MLIEQGNLTFVARIIAGQRRPIHPGCTLSYSCILAESPPLSAPSSDFWEDTTHFVKFSSSYLLESSYFVSSSPTFSEPSHSIALLPCVITHLHHCTTTALCTYYLHKLAPLYSYPHLHLYSFLSDFFGFYYSFFTTCSPHNRRGEGSIPSAGWSLYTGLELAAETCTSTLLTNPRVPSL